MSTEPKERDIRFMRRALTLAGHGWGKTHPNPMVGAVIVENEQVVAEGWHEMDGGPHAERVALTALGRKVGENATLYVTLEPCCTHGRTGACTDAIIQAGIKRVVVGATDPNPAHVGRAFDVLRQAGVTVTAGVLAKECEDLNLLFNHWITQRRSMLAGKVGATLDGKIACRTGDSQWITNEQSRADVMRWRRLFPAIAVGAGTILQDNPKLTARMEGGPEWCPIRFVFDGLLRTVRDRNLPKVYTDEFREKTIVVTTSRGGMGYVRKLRELGVAVWVFDVPVQRVPFEAFRARCTTERIPGILVEGGAQLASEMVQARALDYLFIYQAPILLADDKAKSFFTGLRTEKLDQAIRLAEVRHDQFGDDRLLRGRLVYPATMHVDEARFALEGS